MVPATRATSLVQPLELARRSRALETASLPEPLVCSQPPLALHYLTDGGARLGFPDRPGRQSKVRPRSRQADPLEAWAGSFVQAVVEVVEGDRPLSQLVRWTNRRVYGEVSERQRTMSEHSQPTRTRGPRRAQVATMRIYRPAPDVAEVSARVSVGIRSRAIAARLDLIRDRWMCTAIEFG